MKFIEVPGEKFGREYREIRGLPLHCWPFAFVSYRDEDPDGRWFDVNEWLKANWGRGPGDLRHYTFFWDGPPNTLSIFFRDDDAAFSFKMRWC